MEQLGKLKSLLTKTQKDKVQILAVSVDNHEESKKFGEMLRKRFDGEFDFPLLEDKDHKVIDRYGIFNPDGKGWPHPSTLRDRSPRGGALEICRSRLPDKRATNEQIRRRTEKIKIAVISDLEYAISRKLLAQIAGGVFGDEPDQLDHALGLILRRRVARTFAGAVEFLSRWRTCFARRSRKLICAALLIDGNVKVSRCASSFST